MPDPRDTSLTAAIANTLLSSMVLRDHLNNEMARVYLQNFGGWTTMVLAGKIDNKNPPRPPLAYILVKDGMGFSYPERGSQPVCFMPPIPPDVSISQEEIDALLGPNFIDIGVHLTGNYWSMGPQDTCKPGFRTPPMASTPGKTWPDGAVFEKVASLAGKGWWLRVA